MSGQRNGGPKIQREFHMRPSRVLRKIREGKVASCLKVISSDPRIIETFAASGVDAIWVCTEHTPTNYENIENQVRAAKIFDVDIIVRSPRGSYSDHVRGFEADAAGVMIPHVMNLEDAKQIVRMTKFVPIGNRACDGGNADGLYTRIPFKQYLEEANRERFVIHQIEDPEPLDHLEAIAELPGVDMLFFGPADYSSSIGLPGQIWAPEIDKVRRKVVKVARSAGKIAGTVGTPDTLRMLVDMGYNFINAGGDMVTLAAESNQVVDAFHQL